MRIPSVWKSPDWAGYVAYYVQLYRSRSRSCAINHHDWQDITQSCLLRVWRKRRHYDATLPLKPWLKTLVSRCCQNEIRARLGFSSAHRASRAKWLLRHPIPIWTRIVTTNSVSEEVVYLPDMVDPLTEPTPRVTLDDMPDLWEADRKVLEQLLAGQTPTALAKGSVRKRGRLYAARRRIRAAYLAALDR